MSIGSKVKETVVEYTVLSVLALIGVLAFIVWTAVPSSFWQRLSDAVDKPVLWALVGLCLFTMVGLAVFVVQTYLHQRKALHHYGGVLWNANSEIFCPKDDTPLYQNGVTYSEDFPNAKGVEIF